MFRSGWLIGVSETGLEKHQKGRALEWQFYQSGAAQHLSASLITQVGVPGAYQARFPARHSNQPEQVGAEEAAG
jgi:hypothetical protein